MKGLFRSGSINPNSVGCNFVSHLSLWDFRRKKKCVKSRLERMQRTSVSAKICITWFINTETLFFTMRTFSYLACIDSMSERWTIRHLILLDGRTS